MAGGVISTAQIFGLTMRESADDGSDFTNPGADYRRIFLGEDGLIHLKDSSGTVTSLGGSGIAATIFDAKGDLIAASAADTAAKLTVGTNGHVLTADSAQSSGLKYSQPPGTLLGYASRTAGDVTVTATALTDTGVSVTFDAPASTNVLVRLTGITTITTGGAAGDYISWGVREASSDIAGAAGTSIVHRIQVPTSTTAPYSACSAAFPLLGISGGSHTYKWAHAVSVATTRTATLRGQANAPAVMEIIAL